jgi:hypothetical protein
MHVLFYSFLIYALLLEIQLPRTVVPVSSQFKIIVKCVVLVYSGHNYHNLIEM